MDKKCAFCEKYFKVKPSRFEKAKCCSRKCLSELYKVKMRGENNPNYKGILIDKPCKTCGKIFNGRPESKNCSRKCSSESMRKPNSIRSLLIKKKESPEYKPRKVGVKYYCKICNSLINIRRRVFCDKCRDSGKTRFSKIETCKSCKIEFKTFDKRKKYCSHKCRSVGSSNPNYKGGITPINKKIRASDEYNEWRESVFIRDKYTCMDCGAIGGNLHAHHIKSFSKHPDVRFDVNNGLTLCKYCHSKIHENMNFKIDK